VTTYGYDAVQRLTSAIAGTVTESWTYDVNGNRLTAAKTGTTTINSAYNTADQLCWTSSTGTGTCATPPLGATTYTYDANGNQTQGGAPTSTWTTFDQLASHTNSNGVTTSHTYAGQSNTERLTYGAMSFLGGSLGITRQTNASGTTSFIRDPQGTLISMRNSAGASFYYTTDALGSTILLTDSAQAKAATYLYDAWGNTTTQTGTQATPNPWRFAGGYKDDASGYTKFGARYYSPGIGRFSQPDPSWQEANRYAYVGCNPVNATDPSGLGPLCDDARYWSLVFSVAHVYALILANATGDARIYAMALSLDAMYWIYQLSAVYYCWVGL
jgi:RHS repeat-associated protein